MRRKQRGITIIETLGALAIATMMMFGLSAMIDTSLEDLQGQQAAMYQSQIVEAARKYMDKNYDAMVKETASPSAITSRSIADLVADGFLPSNFSPTNVYRQTTCVLVRQPSPGKLDALVVTSGDMAIEERQIAAVAASAGQGGGYISKSDPGNVRGAFWLMPTDGYRGVPCKDGDPKAPVLSGKATDGGHLASRIFTDGQTAADFLYRHEVGGQPDLTTMHAPIRMSQKDALVDEGAACGADPAIALNKAEQVVSCTSSSDGTRRWTAVASLWKAPVASYAELPDKPSEGEVHLVIDKSKHFSRAFAYDGAKWVALAVDQDGDLAVARNVNVDGIAFIGGSVNVGGNVVAGGKVEGTDITAHNRVNADTVWADNWMKADHVFLTQYAKTAGQPCHILTGNIDENGGAEVLFPYGTIVLDQNGLLLTCAQDHTFRYQNGTYSP